MLGEALSIQGDYEGALAAFEDALAEGAASEELRDQVRFQRAWLMYRQHEFEDAGPNFMEIYRYDPTGHQAGEALFWAAESYYRTGAYQRSTSLFSQFLREFPDHRRVSATHYALGWSYFRAGDYSSAVLSYQRFLAQYDADPNLELNARDARLRLADSYYALKQYGEAARAYRRVQGEDDEQSYAMFQIGQCYAAAERNADAIRAFEDLRARFPSSTWTSEAGLQIAYLKFLERDYEGAGTEYRAIATRTSDPDVACRAVYGIADARYNSGDWPGAEEAYTEVLENYPQCDLVVDAVEGLIYTLLAQGRDADADAVVDTFAENNPDSPIIDELRLGQAEVTLRSGDLEKSIVQFNAYLAAASSEEFHPDAYNYLGQAHNDLQRPDSAKVYLQQVINRYPSHPLAVDASRTLGSIYLEEEDYGRSLRIYRDLQGRVGSDDIARADAGYGYGMSLLGLQRIEDAEALFNQVLADNPSEHARVRAQLGLARVYDDSGRPAQATSFYRQVVRADQGESGAEALCRLGELLLSMGAPEEAAGELSRLPVLYPGYPEWEARGYVAQAQANQAMGPIR